MAVQVSYLRHFRADSIVADAELLRLALDTKTVDKKRWCALGQSFGGFCLTHYLSAAPEGTPLTSHSQRSCVRQVLQRVFCRTVGVHWGRGMGDASELHVCGPARGLREWRPLTTPSDH